MSNAPTENTTDDPHAADTQRNRRDVIREGFKNKTRGEAWFNSISYIGVGYGLVTAVSVFMTWLIRDTKNVSKFFETYALAPVIKRGWSSSIASIGTLFIGGTLASVFPVKWLEDAKPQIVKKLDRLILSDEEFDSPKVKEAHKELEEMPKQTWLSIFGSRVVAFAATFGVYALMGSNKSPFAKITGHSLDEVSIRFGRGMDRYFSKRNPQAIAEINTAIATNLSRIGSHGPDALSGLEVVRGTHGADRVATKVWSYVGIDAIYTLITSISLFVSTRVLGSFLGKPRNPTAHETTHKPSPTIPESAPEPNAPASESPTKPASKVQGFTHLERVAQPAAAMELTT